MQCSICQRSAFYQTNYSSKAIGFCEAHRAEAVTAMEANADKWSCRLAADVYRRERPTAMSQWLASEIGYLLTPGLSMPIIANTAMVDAA